MKHEIKNARARFKAVADAPAGTFEAIVSVFGNVDLGGDRVMPGAFAKTLADWQASGDPIPVIWSHEWDDPESHIGYVLEAQERPEGLWVKAQLDVEHNQRAAYVARLLKDRRVREFSFGYFATGYKFVQDPDVDFEVRELTEIELFEVGPTLLGMNPETVLLEAASRFSKAGRVLSAKNEDALRQARDMIDQVLTAVSDDGKAIGSKSAEAKIATPGWMQANAQQGLDWYAEGLAGDGVTEQTVNEARAMAGGNVSEDKARRMAAWFARHMADLDAPAADPDHEDFPSPGVVAHALWGGGTRRESERAMAWAERQADSASLKAWRVGAADDLPIEDEDPWDGDAAAARVFAWAGFDGDSPDPARARRAFLIYDDQAPDLRGSYKLGFADVEDGELVAITSGLRAAASRLPQTDAPADVLERARAILDRYFARIDAEADSASLDIAHEDVRDTPPTIDPERLAMLLARPRHTEE